jgi:hypothetical protein
MAATPLGQARSFTAFEFCPERRAEKPLDINQLLAGVATLVCQDLERAHVSLRLNLGELLPLVSGCRSRSRWS